MSNTESKKYLQDNLFALGLNFNSLDEETRKAYKTFEPPELQEVLDYKSQSDSVHPVLSEMLVSKDLAKKLYGAILLFEIDEQKAVDILKGFTDDETIIKVQNQIGHGSNNVAVKYLAQSFLETSSIRKGFLETKTVNDRWRISISQELKKNNAKESESLLLPNFENVWEAKDTADKREKLIKEITKLSEDRIISKRFYAAFLLGVLDSPKGMDILKTLLDSEATIPILLGDLVQDFPAKQIASEILSEKPIGSDNYDNEKHLEMHEKIIGKIFNLFQKK